MQGRADSNLEIVRDWYSRGVCGGDPEVLFGHLDPEIEWWCFGPPGHRTNGYYRGHGGVREFFANLEATLKVDLRRDFRPEVFLTCDDSVIVYGIERGSLPDPEGVPFENYFNHAFRLRSEKTTGKLKIISFRVNYTVFPPGKVPPPPGCGVVD